MMVENKKNNANYIYYYYYYCYCYYIYELRNLWAVFFLNDISSGFTFNVRYKFLPEKINPKSSLRTTTH
jgi:hypothetical protein